MTPVLMPDSGGGQEAIEQAAHHDRAAIEQYPRILQVALICELV